MIFRIMVVDDELPIRNWIVHMVNSMPEYFEACIQARDGEEALKKAEKYLPDLVLVDIQMPKMDGLSLVERLKGISSRTEVIILSNYDDFSYARTAFKDGVIEYFLKFEFDREKLIMIYETLKEKRKHKNAAHFNQTIKNQFIYKLLNGMHMNDGEAKRLLDEYEIELSEYGIAGMEIYIPESRNANEAVSCIEGIHWERVFSNINYFMISHPVRLIILLNIRMSSRAEREEKYRECVSRISGMMGLPVGSAEILDGFDRIPQILKACNTSVVGQWMRLRKPKNEGEKGRNSERPQRDNQEFYEIEMLYNEINQQLVSRKNKKLGELLNMLLEEIKTVREFYPIWSNHFLKLLYCRFSEILEHTENSRERMQLEDKAKNLIDRGRYEDIVRVISEMERNYEENIRNVSDVTRQVMQYIAEHYAEISSMQEIADVLNYNGDYLYRRFKQEAGLSFVNYLTRIRLEKAATMIRDEHMEPSRAAETVGYSSVSYFSKKFKEYYGQTPLAWKKNLY